MLAARILHNLPYRHEDNNDPAFWDAHLDA